jgi:CPA2 family monovalent cation:H+ antiporter-2/glutathione-regulated potassium-efflux system protein KefB
MLETLVVLLATSVILIPLSRRAGFGSVLGYLVGGGLIGPQGLRLITDVEEIRTISEFGVVMLLFLIGLELRPQRLWVMRRAVFGLGTGQLVASGIVLAALAHVAGIDWPGSVVLGVGLAMSSTAIALPMLGERDLLGTNSGRDAFAILLFQDLAFVPLVALVPLLAGDDVPHRVPWLDVARAVGAVVAILLGGRFLVRPGFRAIGGARTPEVFTALSLLTVVGAASLAHYAGLSMSLGAFLGGVLLSDSEYRHELQANVEPFEGLLLGFFFMSVGMSADFSLAIAEPWLIAGGVAALLVVKIAITFALGRIAHHGVKGAIRLALALPQGSEFSFVLFGAAVSAGVVSNYVTDRATLIVALSMLVAPILFTGSEKMLIPRFKRTDKPAYDKIKDEGSPVIICGFGRVGQVVGRLLKMRGIPFTALDKDPDQVEVVRQFGNKVYYGDPARPDLLRAAGAESARLLVVALDNIEETLKVVDVAKRTFPRLKIMARARNRRHAHLLMDRAIEGIVRETLYSSLHLGEMVLEGLGVPPNEARRAVELFRQHDHRTLIATHAFYTDERQLIQSTKQAAAELAELFEADRRDTAPEAAAE